MTKENQKEEGEKKDQSEEFNWDFLEEKNSRKQNSSSGFRLAAIFIVGFMIGIALKTQALNSITVGYEDYKKSQYQDDLAQARKKQAQVEQDAAGQPVEQGNSLPEGNNENQESSN